MFGVLSRDQSAWHCLISDINIHCLAHGFHVESSGGVFRCRSRAAVHPPLSHPPKQPTYFTIAFTVSIPLPHQTNQTTHGQSQRTILAAPTTVTHRIQEARVHVTKHLRQLRPLRVMRLPVAAWWHLPDPGRHAEPASMEVKWESKVSAPSVLPPLPSLERSPSPSPSLAARDRDRIGTRDWIGLFVCFVEPWECEGVAPRMRIEGRGSGCLRPFVVGTVGWVWLRRFGIKGWLSLDMVRGGIMGSYSWAVSSRR